MKKKKIILIIIMLLITGGLTTLLIMQNNNNEEKEVIVQSNDRDDTVEQVKITNEFINIRSENDSEAEALGKVYKDEIYTVLETLEDEYYVWCKIKTNNDIEGYIAVKYEEESYVEYLEVKEETEVNIEE